MSFNPSGRFGMQVDDPIEPVEENDMNNMQEFLRTRKFWVALFTLVVTVLVQVWPDFPFPVEAAVETMTTLALVIVGGDIIYDIVGRVTTGK